MKLPRIFKNAVAIVFLGAAFSCLLAQGDEYNTHPELKWETFETPHFTFHYPKGAQWTAFHAAKIIEDIYPAVTGVYNYEPPHIDIVIKDTDDYSNGGAYFFNNKIEIWASNLDYVMRGTSNWLRNVVTHEFTHMVSIQKTMKTSMLFPYGFFQFFGYEKERRKDVVRGFPNVLVSYPLSSINMPVWFAEGVAQYQNNAKRFDYRDPHREMIIRDRILHDRLLSYNAMCIFGKTSHGNESSYNLGFSFVKYLSNRFGEKILSDITAISSKWSSYTFEGVLKKATGISSDSLYADWKDSLTKTYFARTKNIRENTVNGSAIENQGFGNLYPVFSPDGSKIAYVSNKGEDYFGLNDLVLYDRQTKQKKELDHSIVSSLSWSPDGRYIAYAKQKFNKYGSGYNDLFLYDLEKNKEIRLTWNMRGTNPDFSPDGKKIAFITATNGLNQLNVIDLPNDFTSDVTRNCTFDAETGKLVNDNQNSVSREALYKGKNIKQLLAFEDGRQIFHPRWSNDGNRLIFDTAVEYGRNLGVYDFTDSSFKIFMQAEEELRYPVYQRGSDWLYYSASTTGIYNLYRYNTKSGEKELLSNVTGGAFMPSVDKKGEIVYGCYDSLGYKIYLLENPKKIDSDLAKYDPDYIASIPEKNFDDSSVPAYKVQPDKRKFSNTLILPRLLIDYNTIKPGLYVAMSDVLDKLNFVAGGAANSDGDYDLYGYLAFRDLGPELFLEAYNSTANITDTLAIKNGENNYFHFKRGVHFDLLYARLGINFQLFHTVNLSLAYAKSIYSAKLDQDVAKNATGQTAIIPTVRYDYLRGDAFQWTASADLLKKDRFQEINPSGGVYLFFRHSYESNNFLDSFATDRDLGLEVYKNYTYNALDLSFEYYHKSPFWKSHAFGIKLQGGYIDRKVDSFFNYFAGGLLGLRGYPFYSIEGRQMAIGTLTYRFPLSQHLDTRIGHIQLDKLYMGFFYDFGNAFDNNKPDLKKFKRNVGVELRMETFSFNMFPTRLFFEAAYPLDEVTNKDIVYPKEWRYYLGILFDFDLRERLGSVNHFLRRNVF